MAHTVYSNLSDEELLNEFDGKRQHSPVIDELCTRLEKTEQARADQGVDCPVCGAELTLEISRTGNQMTIDATV